MSIKCSIPGAPIYTANTFFICTAVIVPSLLAPTLKWPTIMSADSPKKYSLLSYSNFTGLPVLMASKAARMFIPFSELLAGLPLPPNEHP